MRRLFAAPALVLLTLTCGCGQTKSDHAAPSSGGSSNAGSSNAGSSNAGGTNAGAGGGASGGGSIGVAPGCDLSACRSAKPCCAGDTCGYDVSMFGARLPTACIAQNHPGTQTTECVAREPLCDVGGVCAPLPGCRLPDGSCGYWLNELPLVGEEVIVHEVKAGCVPMLLLSNW